VKETSRERGRRKIKIQRRDREKTRKQRTKNERTKKARKQREQKNPVTRRQTEEKQKCCLEHAITIVFGLQQPGKVSFFFFF